MITYPKVSIIFPNYNGGKEPLECIESIKNLNYPKDKIEIIVIDNKSTDGSLQRIRNQESGIRNIGQKLIIIENEENVGFAKAINQGIKHSNGKYIFITNDDILFEKNSLKYMINYMEEQPKVGITGGKIFLKSNPKKIVSCGYMMNLWTGNVYPAPKPNTIKEPHWVQGCAMLIPKVALKKLGLLDAGFSHYFEDFDICLRAKRSGFSVHYLPNAIFWHGEATTGNKDKKNKYYHWYKNKIRFVIKNLPLINVLSILLFQVLIVTPYRSLFLQDGRFIPFLKGFFWNIIHLPQTLEARRNIV
jgi:GT2 family glycosyltransferase